MHSRIRYKGNSTLLKKTKLERVESMFSSNTDGVGSTTSFGKMLSQGIEVIKVLEFSINIVNNEIIST